MAIPADLRVLLALARGAAGGGSHAERLARFYGPQATAYDHFRERLLQGRRELVAAMPVQPGSRIADLGGGTGRSVEFFADRLQGVDSLWIVDLCEPLLAVARERFRDSPRVRCVLADVAAWKPPAPVDCVYFSYSLTMIPDWRAAIDNAVAMLRPGGMLGVVDFHVSPAHGWLSRTFWPRWFAHDGVRPSADHLPYLQSRLDTVMVEHRRAAVPYLPGMKVPYYLYLGTPRP